MTPLEQVAGTVSQLDIDIFLPMYISRSENAAYPNSSRLGSFAAIHLVLAVRSIDQRIKYHSLFHLQGHNLYMNNGARCKKRNRDFSAAFFRRPLYGLGNGHFLPAGRGRPPAE